MKNNVLVIVLIILVGVFCGIALMISFSNVLQLATAPIMANIKQSQASEKLILNKLDILEKELKAIESRPAQIARPAPAAPERPSEDFNKVYPIEVEKSPILGKKDAPITIVQFTDLQCPFCARFYPPILEVLKAYPDKVRFMIKHYPLPFHPNAKPAAKAALAANEQGKYFEMVELLLKNGADASEAKLKDYAKELNLNYNKLAADLKAKDGEYEQIIANDLSLGEKSAVMGTPTFFINGKKTMARDFNGYKAEIEKILAAN